MISGNEELVLPGEQNLKKPMSNMTILKALERMGYKGRMTGHGFRGLASTILHEQGYNHDHIELQLAHTPRNEVSAAYNHALYLGPRAKMMQEWADILDLTRQGARSSKSGSQHSALAIWRSSRALPDMNAFVIPVYFAWKEVGALLRTKHKLTISIRGVWPKGRVILALEIDYDSRGRY